MIQARGSEIAAPFSRSKYRFRADLLTSGNNPGRLGRGGRDRTRDPRFWRPVLYQLSYTPPEAEAADHRRVRRCDFMHDHARLCKG